MNKTWTVALPLMGLLLAQPALAWGPREQGALAALAGVALLRSAQPPVVQEVYSQPVHHPVVVHRSVRVHHGVRVYRGHPYYRHWHVHPRYYGPVTWVDTSPPVLLNYHSPIYTVHPVTPAGVEVSQDAPPVGCTDIPVKDERGQLLEYRRDCSAR